MLNGHSITQVENKMTTQCKKNHMKLATGTQTKIWVITGALEGLADPAIRLM